MTKLYFFDSLQKLPGTPLGSFFFKMLFVSECENKIYHRRDVIHSLRRMIYLLRKYDIISVPSYALGVPSVQQGTDTIEKALAEASAFSGATGRTRTGDLLITNQLLYQLSHSSITAGAISGYYFILFVFFCQDIIQKNLRPARAAAGRPPAAADRCVKYSFSAQRAPFFRCARSVPAKRRGSSRSCPASGRGKTAA